MAMTLITTNTITSATAASNFTSSIDSTYKLYIFKFYDVRGASDGANFTVGFSINSGSDYDAVNLTTTCFRAEHTEDDATTSFAYIAAKDIANTTGFQTITDQIDTDVGDQSAAGELYLFNPSSTTYVKHFYSRASSYGDALAGAWHAGGYVNNTNDVDAVSFKMSTGNIATSVIKMYGVG
jgi:hypothetical protein